MIKTIARSVVLGAMLARAAAAGAPVTATIPMLHAAALNGQMVDLPAALKGRSAVLVVGFSQGSRGEVAAWGKRLFDDFHDSATVRYYEMPVLSEVPKFLRGYVVRKIAADVPDPAKGHFLPIYDREPEWRSAAGYSKGDAAYVLVVDSAGGVRWRTSGPATEASYREVKEQLKGIRGGSPAN